jgi:hypothetical protein
MASSVKPPFQPINDSEQRPTSFLFHGEVECGALVAAVAKDPALRTTRW